MSDKPEHPEHPHGTPPGQDPDFVPPGQGGTPPGQEKPRVDNELPEPEQPEAEPKE